MNTGDALEFFGILAMGVSTLVFAALWWAAFLTGDPVLVSISKYGERYPEVVLWFIVAPLMLFGMYSYLQRLPSD